MKIRNFFLSVFAVVVMAASPLTAQVLISNNFDGDDSNDLGGAFVISSCLLYTSPSPRDQRGSRMPSSA